MAHLAKPSWNSILRDTFLANWLVQKDPSLGALLQSLELEIPRVRESSEERDTKIHPLFWIDFKCRFVLLNFDVWVKYKGDGAHKMVPGYIKAAPHLQKARFRLEFSGPRLVTSGQLPTLLSITQFSRNQNNWQFLLKRCCRLITGIEGVLEVRAEVHWQICVEEVCGALCGRTDGAVAA